jgi:CheY-like chemotaxis protein
MSAPTLRILIVEDVAADAELEVRELKRLGLRFPHCVVATEKAFIEGVRQFGPDVILS